MNIIGNPKYLHIGTKAVLAHIMTKEEYCDYVEEVTLESVSR